jgi:hypothetical protein
MIPKPKGSIGKAGFSLIAAMMLDKHNPKDKALYNDILVSMELNNDMIKHAHNFEMVQASVRALSIGAGIDLGRTYKDQSITRLSKLMLAVSKCLKIVSLVG